MKTGEAAKILGIDKATIYNWAARPEMNLYFSAEAKGETGATQRLLSESDVLILNTIRSLRTSGTTNWNEIAAILDSGHRVREFPQNAISGDPRMIPMPQAQQAAEVVSARTERDLAIKRMTELEAEVGHLQAENRSLQERLLNEVGELRQKIGRLEGIIEMMEKRQNGR